MNRRDLFRVLLGAACAGVARCFPAAEPVKPPTFQGIPIVSDDPLLDLHVTGTAVTWNPEWGPQPKLATTWEDLYGPHAGLQLIGSVAPEEYRNHYTIDPDWKYPTTPADWRKTL